MLILAISAAAFGLIGCLALFFSIDIMITQRAATASTQGQLISVDPKFKARSSQSYCDIVYSFTVDGTSYQYNFSVAAKSLAGGGVCSAYESPPLVVRYDPEDPSRHYLALDADKPVDGLGIAFACFGLGVLLLVAVPRRQRRRRRPA
ncbi:MAG: DUF3592 domain-containing protein [Propionibacteriaceae bacterium]|nr:DUF3592 domain-containing protein [Propionibacteriaceae bacterium]